mgnify:CR=1 FL=1
MHEKLAGGVREIGAVDLAPGLAIVSGEGAKQKLRPSVVANEADDGFAIGEDVPVRLLGTAFAVVRGERVDAPVIKGLGSADHDGDLSLVIATGHHPFPRRKAFWGKVVHGVVKDRAVCHPFRAVPAKGFQAESKARVSRRVEMAGESEEFAVAFPQTAGDPTIAFDPRRTGQIGGRGPVQTILARGKGIASAREIVTGHDIAVLLRSNTAPRPSRTIAPHGPEAAVMMGQISVLMNTSASLVADVADDGVFCSDTRKFLVVDLVRILRQPVSVEHEGIVWLLIRRIGSVKGGQRREQQGDKKCD